MLGRWTVSFNSLGTKHQTLNLSSHKNKIVYKWNSWISKGCPLQLVAKIQLYFSRYTRKERTGTYFREMTRYSSSVTPYVQMRPLSPITILIHHSRPPLCLFVFLFPPLTHHSFIANLPPLVLSLPCVLSDSHPATTFTCCSREASTPGQKHRIGRQLAEWWSNATRTRSDAAREVLPVFLEMRLGGRLLRNVPILCVYLIN